MPPVAWGWRRVAWGDMGKRLTKRVLVVGWDAADWKIIDPLLAAGKMGNLKRLMDGGVRADLRSLDPKLSPLLWTSIATGKTADKHGILNFIEPEPSGAGFRPSCSTTRKTKALWNILTQSGMRTNVVSWYASHPAEPIAGTVVTNLFQEGAPAKAGGAGEAWPVMAGAVHPASKAGAVGEMRIHPGEITPQELHALLPDLGQMDRRDRRIGLLAKLLAQCASVHNVATMLLQEGGWDCSLVFFETIDVVGHHFMQYYPPRMEHVSEADFERFRQVVPGVYELQDAMLGRLVELAGEGCTVVVLSDHGFHSDHLRPRVQAAVDDPHAAMDATWHRPHGMLVMSGPGVAPGAAVYGAGLLDIAPTVLTLLGLAVGADMDGRVLREALVEGAEIERNFGWDVMEGESGMHPAGMRVDPLEAREAMKQLQDLGYIALGEDAAAQAALYDRETRFNLGVVYQTTGRLKQASEVFEKLYAEHPEEPRFAMNVAHCRYALGRFAGAVEVMDDLVKRYPESPEARLLRGASLFAQGKVEEAAVALEEAVKRSPDRPDLLCTMADAYTHLKRFDEAERTLARAGAIDPHDPNVPYKRAQLELARGRFEEAAEQALTAVELRHFFPEAHYTLGVALTWMKDFPHAIASFEVALSMQPGLLDAHRFLASIHRHMKEPSKARPHREAAERLMASGGSALMPIEEPPLGPQAWARGMGVE